MASPSLKALGDRSPSRYRWVTASKPTSFLDTGWVGSIDPVVYHTSSLSMCEFVSYHIMLWAWNIFGSFLLLNLEVVHNERLASLRKVELGATVATMNRLQRFDFRMLKLNCQKRWRKRSMTLVFQCFSASSQCIHPIRGPESFC